MGAKGIGTSGEREGKRRCSLGSSRDGRHGVGKAAAGVLLQSQGGDWGGLGLGEQNLKGL